jgi:hypothetical protein
MRFISLTFVVVALCFSGCSDSNDPPQIDCNASTLAISLTSKTDLTSCSAIDGKINVSASGGSGPYQFRLNDQSLQSSGAFSGLTAGSYNVTVKDADDCERSLTVSVQAFNTNLALAAAGVVPDSQCLSDNGSISVSATGGQGPFQFQLGTGSFGNSSSFSSLRSGNYAVSVRDAVNCIQTINVTVPRLNTGTSFTSEIKTIIDNNCISCHRVGGTGPGDFTTQAGLAARAAQVKARTGAGTMPPGGGLTPAQISLIACWVDDGAPNN